MTQPSLPVTRNATVALVIGLAGLLLTWPLFGRMTLKLLLMTLVAGGVAYLLWRQRPEWRAGPALRPILLAVAALSVWFLVQALTIAHDPLRTLHELWSHWVRNLMTFGAGAGIGLLATYRLAPEAAVSRLLTVIFFVFLAQVLIGFGEWTVAGIRAGGLAEPESVLYQNRFHYSLITSLLAAFVGGESLLRVITGGRFLKVGNLLLAAALALLLAFTLLLQTRQAWMTMIILAAAILVIVGTVVLRSRALQRRRLGWVYAAVLAVVALWLVSLTVDPRWAQLREAAPIALDIQKHDAWRNFHGTDAANWPRLEGGQPIDHSAYMRIAWARATVALVLDHPLGTGYERNAFARAVNEHFGASERIGARHTHSGVADLLLATGWPGLGLWFVLQALLVRLAWRSLRRGLDGPGLIALLLFVGIFYRSLVDSTMFDYVEERSMLLIGLFAVLLSRPAETPSA